MAAKIYHCTAKCNECAWKDENYLSAQSNANKHSEETGHEILMDLGYVIE